MNAPEQQAMLQDMGVQVFYMGACKDDPKRATVIFKGPKPFSTTFLSTPKPGPSLKLRVVNTTEH